MTPLVYERAYQARTFEIEAAKETLLALHRARAEGVVPKRREAFEHDSWGVK